MDYKQRIILSISQLKKNNMPEYNDFLQKHYDRKKPWKEVKELSEDELRWFEIEFEKFLSRSKSAVDVEKLAKAIQYSRTGVGGAMITNYTCMDCKQEFSWGNTAVPKICYDCCYKMADRIVTGKNPNFILKETESV